MNHATQPVYTSTLTVSATNPLDALEQTLPITSRIELSGGCSYDPDLLQKRVDYKKTDPVNLLLHSFFPPPAEYFVLNFADTGSQARDFITCAMEYIHAQETPYYSIDAAFKKDFVSNHRGIHHKIPDRKFTLDEIAK